MASANRMRQCRVEGCKGTARKRGWCPKHYERWRKHGNTYYLKAPFTDADRAAAFWQKVDTSGSCWLWTGGTKEEGYGCVNWAGVTRRAHHVSWFLTSGSWPRVLHCLHRCDNPRCVRPSHLFLGTHQDNVADMVAKGRQRKGERHGMARLTDAGVLAIRAACAAGEAQATVARRHGVTQTTVSRIILRRSWRHV